MYTKTYIYIVYQNLDLYHIPNLDLTYQNIDLYRVPQPRYNTAYHNLD